MFGILRLPSMDCLNVRRDIYLGIYEDVWLGLLQLGWCLNYQIDYANWSRRGSNPQPPHCECGV